MEKSENQEFKRLELVAVAKAMLAGHIHLIEGVRRICDLRFAVDAHEHEVFLPFRGIESETDTFLLGDMRANCSAEYLQRMDDELRTYLSDAQADIYQACEEVVRTFS